MVWWLKALCFVPAFIVDLGCLIVTGPMDAVFDDEDESACFCWTRAVLNDKLPKMLGF